MRRASRPTRQPRILALLHALWQVRTHAFICILLLLVLRMAWSLSALRSANPRKLRVDTPADDQDLLTFPQPAPLPLDSHHEPVAGQDRLRDSLEAMHKDNSRPFFPRANAARSSAEVLRPDSSRLDAAQKLFDDHIGAQVYPVSLHDIVFVVITGQVMHNSRVKGVRAWSRHAADHHVLLFSDAYHPDHPVYGLPDLDMDDDASDIIRPKYGRAWMIAQNKWPGALFRTLKWFPRAKWIAFADDDTMYSPINLRRKLSQFDPNRDWYLGQRVFGEHGVYLSGGAGWVGSRSFVHKLAQHAQDKDGDCDWTRFQTSDVWIGSCANQLGIHPTQIPGFYSQSPAHYLDPKHADTEPPPVPYPISFHYLHWRHMWALDPLLNTGLPFDWEHAASVLQATATEQ